MRGAHETLAGGGDVSLPEVVVHKPQSIEEVQDLVRSVDRLYTMPLHIFKSFQAPLVADAAMNMNIGSLRNKRSGNVNQKCSRRAREKLSSWADPGPIHLLARMPSNSSEINPNDMVIRASGLINESVLAYQLERQGAWFPSLFDQPQSKREQEACSHSDYLWQPDYRTPYYDLHLQQSASLHHAISANLPHSFHHICGDWRNLILGMTVVLADGTVARVGSNAVKNVAGYDAQKLFIGSLGSFGVIVEVILRMIPRPKIEPHIEDHIDDLSGEDYFSNLLQRVMPSDFESAKEKWGSSLRYSDRNNSYLFGFWSFGDSPPRFPGDQVWRLGHPPEVTETQKRFMLRAKEIFDPTHKFNPGIWGFM